MNDYVFIKMLLSLDTVFASYVTLSTSFICVSFHFLWFSLSLSLWSEMMGQSTWTSPATGKIVYNPTGGVENLGINTSSAPNFPLDFQTTSQARMLALYSTTSGGTFYGLGIGAGTLRFEIPYNTVHRFGFFSGTDEIFKIQATGYLEAISNNPDLRLDLKSTGVTGVGVRLRVNGVDKGIFFYERTTQQVQFFYEQTQVMRYSTADPTYWLTVNKGIQTGKLKVDAALADYVFEDDYTLTPLDSVKAFIDEHKHLPGVISAAQVETDGGVELAGFVVSLQEKLEELYLHTIELNKKTQALEAKIESLTSLQQDSDTRNEPAISTPSQSEE